MTNMDKYVYLIDYLKRETRDDFYLSLKQIEEISGVELPKSAHEYSAYWSTSGTHYLANQIWDCGFKVSPDLRNKRIRLIRVGKEVSNAERAMPRKVKNEERLHPEMTQKDEIILHLTEKGIMTHRELSIAMYGDGQHLSNINESLQSLVREGVVNREGDHPAYYSLSGHEAVIPTKPVRERKIPVRLGRREDIPNPTVEEVKYWLAAWDKLEDYESQERAVNRVFRDYYSNSDLENILIKCSVLNDFYSTNIFKIYPVAKHILSLHIDERLKGGDPTLVDDIAKNDIGGKIKNFYSFASKYCSHHNQLEFPIYDSYVHKVLKYYQKVDRFSRFDENDLKNYPKFKKILIEFRKFYGLEQFNLKELDKYLWQFGKKYFPKNY